MKTITRSMIGVAFAASASAFAESPDPRTIRIQSITYAGSGCSAGSVAGNISDDAHAFTLLFDSYVAELNPALPLSESRKACTISMKIQIPQGWQYSVLTVDTRGGMNLERSVRGVQSNRFFFEGQGNNSVAYSSTFLGPRVGDYRVTDRVGITSLVWSPCGVTRNLNIATKAQLSASSSHLRGLLTVDSIDGEVRLIYGVQWRRCR